MCQNHDNHGFDTLSNCAGRLMSPLRLCPTPYLTASWRCLATALMKLVFGQPATNRLVLSVNRLAN